VLNFTTIYFYHIIKKKFIKKVIKFNGVHDVGSEGTKIDLICHYLNIFFKLSS